MANQILPRDTEQRPQQRRRKCSATRPAPINRDAAARTVTTTVPAGMNASRIIETHRCEAT